MIIIAGMYLQTVATSATFRAIPNAADEAMGRLRSGKGQPFMPAADMIKFGVYCLGSLAYGFCEAIWLTFYVLYGTRQGMSLARAAQMITLLHVSNVISRRLVAAVGGRRWFPRHLVFAITTFAGGIASLLFLRAEKPWVFALCCLLYGCSFGIKTSMQTTILVHLYGIQNLPMIQSIYLLFDGIGVLSGPLTAGKNLKGLT
ncbi:PREDICTED: uncharacterized protein LOC106806077 [Priapulus caudatus]|uniref:Uncharacterized protein LOC106806077 n=1 Tax=Priapulus caudatus TaxID=37621 RepID=A0ABM1DTZ0_PRICU|nr:PREDICTED: uncharacterized protein LOC106806077 [Priapulus caudatus]